MFFVISGFLITTLLLHEIDKTGRINLGKFYLRRTFRIFPAYFFYLGVIAVLCALGIFELRPGDLLHAVTYTQNYHGGASWYVGHAWSLSVEEQFYLLWPATLLLVGLRRGFKAAAGLLLVAPILRVVYFVVQPAGLNPAFAFETVGDAIAAGCLLASCREKLWNYLLYRQLLQSRRMLAVPTALVAAGFLGSGYAKGFNPNMLRGFMQSLGYTVPEILAFLYQLLGISVLNVCIAVCIDWCIRFPISRVGRLLNSALLIQIGVMSYSIYLWQQPFLNNGDSRDLAAYPLNIVLVLLAATFSYYLVERPMLRAREYVEPRIWQPLIAARRGVTATLEVKTEGHEG